MTHFPKLQNLFFAARRESVKKEIDVHGTVIQKSFFPLKIRFLAKIGFFRSRIYLDNYIGFSPRKSKHNRLKKPITYKNDGL
jgi:hypothetical protein